LARIGTQSRMTAPPPEKKPMRIPYKKYDNKGTVSKAL
jgi:hypothetical protein